MIQPPKYDKSCQGLNIYIKGKLVPIKILEYKGFYQMHKHHQYLIEVNGKKKLIIENKIKRL